MEGTQLLSPTPCGSMPNLRPRLGPGARPPASGWGAGPRLPPWSGHWSSVCCWRIHGETQQLCVQHRVKFHDRPPVVIKIKAYAIQQISGGKFFRCPLVVRAG